MSRLLKVLFLFSFSVNTVFGQYEENQVQKDSTVAYQKTAVDKKRFRNSLLVSGGLAGAGVFALVQDELVFSNAWIAAERNIRFPDFETKADDIIPVIPVVAVYGLNLAGVKGKNDFTNRSILLIKAELINLAITLPLKYATNQLRPDESNNYSFPSGHTAHAFMAATFMHKEFGDQSFWYSVAAFTTASSVGVLRILNNRHHISDVLAGAGIGILSTNIAYITHQYRWKDGSRILTIVPTYTSGLGIFIGLRM